MNPQQHFDPNDLRARWKEITGAPSASAEAAPSRKSLRSRLRAFAIALIDTTRDLVSGETAEAESPPLRPPYSHTSPYGMQGHAAPPSYPVVVEARREILPVNSAGHLCPECQKNFARNGLLAPLAYKVKKGERVAVTARPQRVAFRPERITIENADRWIVHDIKIGNRSQFAQSGDIPGSFFDARNTDTTFQFETVQTAMDVVFDVTYIGDVAEGEQFLATVTGTAAV